MLAHIALLLILDEEPPAPSTQSLSTQLVDVDTLNVFGTNEGQRGSSEHEPPPARQSSPSPTRTVSTKASKQSEEVLTRPPSSPKFSSRVILTARGGEESLASDREASSNVAAIRTADSASSPNATNPSNQTGDNSLHNSGHGTALGHSGNSGNSGSAGATGEVSSERKVKLLASSMHCADLFPYNAQVDAALVSVEVDVSARGVPRKSRIVEAQPHDAIFDKAALICAQRLRFEPARTAHGELTDGRATIRLRFKRS